MRADDFVIHEWEKEKWDEYENIQRYIAGFKKGRAKGREKIISEIIKKMLENNLDLNIISKISGKSISQIKNIQKQMST